MTPKFFIEAANEASTNMAKVSVEFSQLSDHFKSMVNQLLDPKAIVPTLEEDCPACGYRTAFSMMPPPGVPFRCFHCGTAL